ncbi:molybdopterin-containing oxidoreductase family protein [Raoultibacter phocaeensis]|uniref:molybdopterin-containing oxidoreductase family protein n=1 Tax=Raoultibacter phocaeensis TaxID=2479841 RepID=UPI00111A4645|nr:molybdopterin-dependent oxidoreductase [Raoultibacter phocaeensis]
MSGANSPQGGLTRRSFLKTTGVVAGAAAVLGGSASTFAAVAAESPDQVNVEKKVTYCRGNCGANMCSFDVKVRDGKVILVEPRIHADSDPATKGRSKGCLRGMSMMQTLYNDRRVKYPLRRVEGSARGAGEWERISWDEALDEIVQKWGGYMAEFGPSSIVRWSIYGSTVMLNGSYGSWQRLCNTLGLSNFLPGADQAMMWTVNQLLGQLGVGCDGPSISNFANSIILWGGNPAECSPHEFRFIQDAQERGAKVTLIDPLITPTATKASQHIRLRPSTDTVLGMACAKYLIDNDMVDWEFQLKSSTAMYLVKLSDGKFLRDSDFGIEAEPNGMSNSSTGVAYVNDPAFIWDNAENKAVHVEAAKDPAFMGTFTVDVNGEQVQCTTALSLLYERVSEWTLERAAEVCDVAEQEIIDLANAMWNGPTVFALPNGLGHTTNSHTAYTAAMACAVLTGNFLKPGAGWSYCGVTSSMGWVPVSYYQHMIPPDSKPGPVYSSLKFPEIMEEGKYAGEDAIIKSVIVISANPLSNVPDRQAMLKAWNKVDFTVTVDPIMTETAQYSDLVLPAAQWLEEEDASVAMFTPYTPYGEKCVEPTFEHKSDFDIAKELGIKLGLEALYTQSYEEVINEMFHTSINALTGGEPTDITGELITRERLQQEKTIRVMPDEYYDPYFLLQDYRVSFYLENPIPINFYGETIDVDKEHLPYFEPPAEAWVETADEFKKNPLVEKYPLIYFQTHNRYRTHTTTGYNPWLLELQDGPVLHMNEQDAVARGLEDGNIVRVFNDRGFVVVKLRVDNAMRPGVVNLPHGWQADQFIAGHYQDLTSCMTHPFDCNDNYYDCLCEVERYEGGSE